MEQCDNVPLSEAEQELMRVLLYEVYFRPSGCWVHSEDIASDADADIKGPGLAVATYELLVGPIPEGRLLYATCENSVCLNPDHLEPVIPSEYDLRVTIGAAHRERIMVLASQLEVSVSSLVDGLIGIALQAEPALMEFAQDTGR